MFLQDDVNLIEFCFPECRYGNNILWENTLYPIHKCRKWIDERICYVNTPMDGLAQELESQVST